MRQKQAPLRGKKAVITGGATGIGFAIAQTFVDAGAEIVIASRNEERLQHAVKKLGSTARAVVVDVSDESQLQVLFNDLDRVDVLVTCAGGAMFNPIEETSVNDAKLIFESRFWGQFVACQLALPKMNKGAAIVFCSGIADRVGLPFFSVCTAIDGAINALTRSLSVELAPRGIRVNAISPGLIANTQIQTNLSEAQRVDFFEQTVAQIPLCRAGEPLEVAEIALTLATATYLTGQVVEIDGGWSAT